MTTSRLRTVGSAVLFPDLRLTVALALVLRAVASFLFPASETETYEFGVIARNLVDGKGYSYFVAGPGGIVPGVAGPDGLPLPSAFMPPGYTAVVAVAYRLADLLGGGEAAAVQLIRVVNLLLAAILVVVAHRLGRRLYSESAGRFAALAVACFPAFVYLSTQVSAGNLYLPLEAAMLLAAVIVARGPDRPSRVAALGAVLGLLCLVRAEAVALIGVFGLWLVAVYVRRKVGRRLAVGCLAAFVACSAVLPGLWLVRNSVVLETPTVTIATTGGFNLWIGNHPGATGSWVAGADRSAEPFEARERLLPATADFEVRRDALYGEAALVDMRADPVGTVIRDVRKFTLLTVFNPHDARAANPVYLLLNVAVMVGGIAGAVVWARRGSVVGRGSGPVLTLYVAFAVTIPCVFFVLARSELPLDMLLAVLSGVGAARLLRGGPDDGRIADGDVLAARVREPSP